MTRLKMMNPTSSIDDVYDFVKETVLLAGENACPPMTVGIGAGGTAEVAAKLAKLALFKGKPVDLTIENVLDVKMLTTSTHIASLPVCVNLNCHSVREIEIKIKENKIYVNCKISRKSGNLRQFVHNFLKISSLKRKCAQSFTETFFKRQNSDRFFTGVIFLTPAGRMNIMTTILLKYRV